MTSPAEIETEQTGRIALYRLYAEDGTLLYVGISKDPKGRFWQHAADKFWWPTVARKTVEWYESRPAALLAEEAAIRTKRPEWNRDHSELFEPLTVTLGTNVSQVNGLEILARDVGCSVSELIQWLIVRELAARGLLGESPCFYSLPQLSWPDGIIVRALSHHVSGRCLCGGEPAESRYPRESLAAYAVGRTISRGSAPDLDPQPLHAYVDDADAMADDESAIRAITDALGSDLRIIEIREEP